MAKNLAQTSPSTAPASAPDTPWYGSTRNQAVVLFMLAIALYANTLGHDFAVDDAIVIYENSLVQQGPSAVPEIFAHDTFYGFFEDDTKANLVAGGRYRPLTLVLFAIEQAISEGPFIGHLFNVLWYGALAVVLTYFLATLLRSRGAAWWVAPLAALLFVAHPIHTEAVANIKGRDEIVSLLFAVLAAWLAWRAARDGSWLGAAAGAVCLGLGCLAKETAFTFLAVVPAVLIWFPHRKQGGLEKTSGTQWRNLLYYLPTLLAGLAYLALRTYILPEPNTNPSLELMNNPFLEWTGTAWREVPDTTRLATGFHTLLLYLKQSFFPFELVHDYYPTAIELKTWRDVSPWVGLLVHVAMGAFLLVRARNYRPVLLGTLIYLSGLSVASNLLFPVGTLMSERFLFFPSLGWAIVVSYTIYLLTKRFGARLAYVGVAVAGVFAVLTVLRNPDWKDNYTLFTTDVEKQPDSAKLLNAAGGARVDRYQSLPQADKAGNRQLLTDAIANLSRAVEVHPTYRNAYLLRGNANLLLENFDAAISNYNQALAIDPDYAPAEDNLVIALTSAGQVAGEQRGDVAAALGYLKQAERLRPMDYGTLRLLGVASGVSGDSEAARAYFERALAVRPNDADALWNYGIALAGVGRVAEAEGYFNRARVVRPDIEEERRR